MKLLCTLFLSLLLISSCSSRRLEYQQIAQDKSEPLTGMPENIRPGNVLRIPAVPNNAYSYAPSDARILIPRPIAPFIQYKDNTSDSVLLKERLASNEEFIIIAKDSRFRPAVGTALPIEHVDRELNKFFQNNNTSYTSIDPEILDMTECVIIYKLEHLESPLYLCLQMTLESVYIASQAEDADDKSLDAEGEKLLRQFAQALL